MASTTTNTTMGSTSTIPPQGTSQSAGVSTNILEVTSNVLLIYRQAHVAHFVQKNVTSTYKCVLDVKYL